jgi:hypothetical protein
MNETVRKWKQVYTVYSGKMERAPTFFMQSFPITFPALQPVAERIVPAELQGCSGRTAGLPRAE